MIPEIIIYIAGLFAIIGAIGLFRFKDFYLRSHAATIITVGGVTLALVGAMVKTAFLGPFFFKILIIIILLVLTSPTSTHAIAKRAYEMGIMPVLNDDGKNHEKKENIKKKVAS